MKNLMKFLIAAAVFTAALTCGASISAFAQGSDSGTELTQQETAEAPETTVSEYANNTTALRVALSSDECDGYEVAYSSNSDMSSKTVINAKYGASNVKISDLSPGTYYYVKARAYVVNDGVYTYGSWSSKLKLATKPEAVELSFKARSTEAIRVTYTETKCGGYQIRYSKNSNMTSAKYITKSSSSSEAKISGLKSGTKYYIQIRAFRKVNGEYIYSAWSNKVSNITKPAKVTVSSLTTPSQTSLKVKWGGVTCTGYQVQYSKSSTFSSKKSVYVKDAKSVKLSSLTAGETYYVRVRAYKTYDGTKYYGEWSSVKKQKVYKTKKIVLSTTIQSSASWASSSLTTISSGKQVRLITKTGNWYKVKCGDYTGYVYNLAFNKSGSSNLKRANINTSNYKTYLDDIIFSVGKGRYDLYTYAVNHMSYSYSKISAAQRNANINSLAKVESNEAELTAVALKQQGGICYNFAALTKTLLERAGYDVQYIYGKNKNGSHCWVIINTSDGYRHIDAVRKAYLYTDKQMKSSSNTKDFSWTASSYPKCV
ncbi:MAG: fibronectin type III domain-containing protein [Clostridiales bacterium]|nr:fibronectin type III domain-containing protein [Clostridiales bacterium]